MGSRLLEKYGPWALVAGAAEGIGEGFTRELAARGFNLVMADRKEEALLLLSKTVETEFGILTRPIVQDLNGENAAGNLMDAIGEMTCRLLIYNAAYSKVRPFLLSSGEELDRYINVNARCPLKLAHAFALRLKENHQPGGILLMSSLAGLTGPPFVAPYAATKAFSIRLAESLSAELAVYGIDVSVCCSGTVSTPTYREGNPQLDHFRPVFMSPGAVAQAALDNLGKKTVIIPGWKNRMNDFLLTRIFPRKVALRLVAGAMKKMYRF